MVLSRRVAALVALLVVFAATGVTTAGAHSSPSPSPAAAARVVPGLDAPALEALHESAAEDGSVAVLVRLRSALSSSRTEDVLEGALAGTGASVEGIGGDGAAVIQATPAALDRLAATTSLLASAQPDVPEPAALSASVPVAWGTATPWGPGGTQDGTGQVIAVLDTGVQSNHPFLAGAVTAEACFAFGPDGPGGAGDCPGGAEQANGAGAAAPCAPSVSGCEHGTHVAGIAAGRRGVPGAPNGGMAPGASILAIRVFSTFTGSNCTGNGMASPCALSWVSDQLRALTYVDSLTGSLPLASVNMSIGGAPTAPPCDNDIRKSVIDSLRAAGVATVVAAGNAGSTSGLGTPACVSSAVSVGATSVDGNPPSIAPYSNSQPAMTLLAPGGAGSTSILSSVPGSAYALRSGTSMATPHVAGAFAVLRQAQPTASVSALVSLLRATGTPIVDGRPGAGWSVPLIRLDNALNVDLPGAPTLVGATPGNGRVTVSFTPPADTGGAPITSYVATATPVDPEGGPNPPAGATEVTVSGAGSPVAVTGLHNGFTYVVRVRAANGAGSGPPSAPSDPRRPLRYISGLGYLVGTTDGRLLGLGDASPIGGGPFVLARPVVGLATTLTGDGAWLVADDGGIFSFGDAEFHGSTGGIALNRPIVGMASTAGGEGYWLVASDGGIFSFGDAAFHGSTGDIKLNQPVVGMTTTGGGLGYWMVARDGGIFAFGDAVFHGSTGNITLNQPIVGMSPTPTGQGYWLVARDGGIFAFGDAAFFGSTGGIALNQPIVGMVPTPGGAGYWLVAADGGVFAFGDAAFVGSGSGTLAGNGAVVGISR